MNLLSPLSRSLHEAPTWPADDDAHCAEQADRRLTRLLLVLSTALMLLPLLMR